MGFIVLSILVVCMVCLGIKYYRVDIFSPSKNQVGSNFSLLSLNYYDHFYDFFVKRGILQFMGLQRVRCDIATEQQGLISSLNLIILEEHFDSKSNNSGNDPAAATTVLFPKVVGSWKMRIHLPTCMFFWLPVTKSTLTNLSN